MTNYTITYDTKYGETTFEGAIGQSYKTFIAEATKAGVALGLIAKGDSVLDHDNEIYRD